MKASIFLRKVVPFLLLVFGIFVNAQTGLKVTYYDGTTQNFAVADTGKLYFSGTNLMIKSSSTATATSLPISIIRKVVFDSSVLSTQNISVTQPDFILYPNPASDFISIKSPKTEKINILIYSADGRILHKGTYNSNENIDVKWLNTGVYFIKANDNTFKLIKK